MRRIVLLALLCVIGLLPSVVRADDSAAETFRRAEIADRTLGRLEEAAALYLLAAKSSVDIDDRARAEIRAAACLRRSGFPDRARKLLLTWLDETAAARLDAAVVRAAERERALLDGTSSDPRVGTKEDPADAERLQQTQQELEQMRLHLESALSRAEGSEKSLEQRAADLQAKDRELAELRERLPAPEPTSPEDALARRRAELEQQRQDAAAHARVFLKLARRQHENGRFEDARETLRVALEKEPDNAEARALLKRVTAPLGARERLYREVLDVLALARDVRRSRLTAELSDLVSEARRRQLRGELAGSIAPLERALALLDSGTVDAREPGELRREIRDMLTRAEESGAARQPVDPLVLGADDEEWLRALRTLLADAGAEVSSGLLLRFHELRTVLATAAGSLPAWPVGETPSGWTLTGEVDASTELLVGYLAGTEAQALRGPGASLVAQGSTAVAVADAATQRRLGRRITEIGLAGRLAIDLSVEVHRLPGGELGPWLNGRGYRVDPLPDGGRLAVIPAADARAVERRIRELGRDVVGTGTFRTTPLRSFRVSGGTVASNVSIDVLAVGGERPGVGVAVEVAWRPRGRPETAQLRRRLVAGSGLSAGQLLVVFGLTDPEAPDADVVSLIGRTGNPLPAPTARAGTTSRPDPAKPGEAVPRGAVELQLPPELLALDEQGPPLLEDPANPLPDRRAALLAHLQARAPGAALLKVSGDRVLVVGDTAVQDAVRGVIADLTRVRGVQRFEVRMHAVTSATELRVERAVRGWNPLASSAFAWTIVDRGADLRELTAILATSGEELRPTEPRPVTPPTGRADTARLVRTLRLAEVDVVSAPRPAWGTLRRVFVDEGLTIGLRPFGARSDGRVPLQLDLRAVRVTDVPTVERTTPLGGVPVVEPQLSVLSGSLAADLPPDAVLVIAALANPFGRGSERSHLVVQVRLGR